jgi:hypothetical protein
MWSLALAGGGPAEIPVDCRFLAREWLGMTTSLLGIDLDSETGRWLRRRVW